jgi:hypothetical protein
MSERFINWKILRRNEVDESKWPALLEECAFPYFQSLWYLDAVFPNWELLVVGDYESVLPLFSKNKFGVIYNLTPLFFRALEWMGKSLEMEETHDFLCERFHFFKLSFHLEDNTKHVSNPAIFQCLTMGKTYEELNKLYSTNLKRKLKDFVKSKARLEETKDFSELINLFRMEKGAQFGHLGNHDFERLNRLMENGWNVGQCFLLKVVLNGKTLASAAFIKIGKKLLYLKGIVTAEGKKIGAMQAIFDAVIQSHCEVCIWLDFGGSNNEGLADFNRKFGASDFQYLLLSQLPKRQPLKWVVQKKWKIK